MTRKREIADYVRMPKTVERRLADLKIHETAETDDQFIKLYTRYLSGKLLDVRTRIDIKTVVPGFFRTDETGNFENVGLRYPEQALDSEMWHIRLGFRPPLFLYKCFVGPAKGKLLCSDDLLPFHAYSKLGIRYVPAVILGKHPECLCDSGICTRGHPEKKDSRFSSLLVYQHTKVPSLVDDWDDFEKRDPLSTVEMLTASIQATKVAVTEFHRSSQSEVIHYHHTLFSVLCSMEQLLHGVKLLLQNKLDHQIRPLVRSAYDLFLNFYVDWLYPEKMGALFQALAVLSRMNKLSAEYRSLDDAIRETFGGLVDILMNQSDKGRLSPLGGKVHHAIYSDLSPSVHQDFGVTQEFGDSLETGVVDPLPRDELTRVLRYLNVVVSATIIRIADDVGKQLTTDS